MDTISSTSDGHINNKWPDKLVNRHGAMLALAATAMAMAFKGKFFRDGSTVGDSAEKF